MRIAIDIRNLEHPITGTQRYELCLLRSLAELDRDNEYILCWRTKCTHIVQQPNFRYLRLPCSGFRYMAEQILLPFWLAAAHIDVYHSPLMVPPRHFRGGKVMTIHDVIHERFPEIYAGHLLTQYFHRYRHRAVRWTDVVLCDSLTTARDVIDVLGACPEQIRVVYLGVDARFREVCPSDLERVRQRYQLPQKYILSVASLDVRKNLAAVLQAYAQLRAEGLDDFGLVLVGKPGVQAEMLYEEIRRLGIERAVRLTGYMPDVDLPAIYAGASAFAYPSLYEGFGLPPLEAMAAGVPVVVSNVSALPEIAGDAALYVDPHDVQGLVRQLRRVLTDQSLRNDLQQRGRAHVLHFDWRRTAEQTLQAYIEAKQIADRRARLHRAAG